MYTCRDCEKFTFEEVGICECCALFCHKGHNVVISSGGKKLKEICDCGAGLLDDIETMNSHNPLKEKIKKEDQAIFDYSSCSLKQVASKVPWGPACKWCVEEFH